MQLTGTTTAVRRQAGCDLLGCILQLMVIGNALHAKHLSGGRSRAHCTRFDQTQELWEIAAIDRLATTIKGDHSV